VAVLTRTRDVPNRSIPKTLRWLAVAALVGLAAPGRALAAGAARDDRAAREAREAGARVATEIATLTGVSLSPLLGMSVLGAGRWISAPARVRDSLPWHQQPRFWGWGLAIVAALFLGDKVPLLRHLVKHVKVLESKLSGLVAAPILAGAVSDVVGAALDAALHRAAAVVVPPAHASIGDAAAAVASGAGQTLAFAAALGVAAAVWLAGHAIDVLVLISPFAPLDWALRTARLGLVLAVVGAARVHPAAGLVVTAAYVLVALLVAGWSFRLTVLGTVFSTDFLLARRVPPGPHGVRAFAGAALPGVRRRTYGRIERAEGRLVFTYRPWLLLRRRAVPIPGRLGVAEGLVSPVLTGDAGRYGFNVARFPPRYRGRAAELADALGAVPAQTAPVARGAVEWLRGG
jgi:hypothetical protein